MFRALSWNIGRWNFSSRRGFKPPVVAAEGGKMISGMYFYYWVNGLIALAALASAFLLPRLLNEGGSKLKVVAASVLLILSGVIFSVSLRIFKLAEIAYAGEGLGRAKEGTYAFVSSFKDIALVGNIFELLAIILLASLARALMRRRAGVESEKESV
jgi:hypothetical protein